MVKRDEVFHQEEQGDSPSGNWERMYEYLAATIRGIKDKLIPAIQDFVERNGGVLESISWDDLTSLYFQLGDDLEMDRLVMKKEVEKIIRKSDIDLKVSAITRDSIAIK